MSNGKFGGVDGAPGLRYTLAIDMARPNHPPRIVVVGSFVADLVFKVARRPLKGETLIGSEFGLFTGGKGFNQAVAAARLGAQVSMVSRLGADVFGDMFLRALERQGIDAAHVVRDEQAGTGVASPVIYASEGDNSIVLARAAR